MIQRKIEVERTINPYQGTVRWGAVIGGWLFAYALAMLLFLFGAAAGLTSFAVMNELNKEVTLATGAWMIFAWIIATFVGGIVSSRLGGIYDKGTGALHGLLVWSLAGIMTLLLGTAQAAVLAGTGIAAGKGVASIAQKAPEVADGVQIPEAFKQTFTQEFKTRASQTVEQTSGVDQARVKGAIDQLDQATISVVSAQLLAGNTTAAKNTLAGRTSLTEQDINRVVTGLSEQTRQATAKAEQAIEQAGDISSVALWALFFASLFGLAAGALGGVVGARAVALTYVRTNTIEETPYVKSGYAKTDYEVEQDIQKRKVV